ncbi:MAG: hypothetical protein J6N70_19280 [Oribacterium sp.]|nr:hypothetical protein [Oribacterium sp.]
MHSKDHLTTTEKSPSSFFMQAKAYGIGGAFIGIILFLLIYGIAPLVPTNVSFLYNSPDQDVMSHQFGFDFYRYSPWQHPLGQTDHYPYPYVSSVINSDSIPIFALFFKLISPLLPEYFQYFGLWIFLCFALQGFSASLLLHRLKVRFVPAMCAVPLFICNVPLLFRCFHHSALTGQWLILLCFLLILDHNHLSLKKQLFFWSLLCGLSVWIHGYLFIMVGLLMTLNCIYHILKEHQLMPVLAVFFSCVITTLFFYYEGGGFISYPNVPVWGLGLLTFDLTDLFNPTSFSTFLPGVRPPFSTENASYLGLGIILLFFLSIVLIFNKKNALKKLVRENSLEFRFCLFSVLLITLLSFGVCARFAGHPIYDLRPVLSEKSTIMLSNFRSSARFFWPVWYLMLLVCLTVICRSFKSRDLLCILLIASGLLQYTDVVPNTANGGSDIIINGYSGIPATAFENCYSAEAKHLCFLGPSFITNAAVFAAHNHMTLNASKVGRGLKNAQQFDTEKVRSGELRSDTVYVLPLKYAHYIYPVKIPEDFRIFYCSDCLYISDTSLILNPPHGEAVEISLEDLIAIAEQLHEAHGDAPSIPSYDEI